MPAFLRIRRDNLSVDELDVIFWRQDAGIDHPVVLLPGPPPQLYTQDPTPLEADCRTRLASLLWQSRPRILDTLLMDAQYRVRKLPIVHS